MCFPALCSTTVPIRRVWWRSTLSQAAPFGRQWHQAVVKQRCILLIRVAATFSQITSLIQQWHFIYFNQSPPAPFISLPREGFSFSSVAAVRLAGWGWFDVNREVRGTRTIITLRASPKTAGSTSVKYCREGTLPSLPSRWCHLALTHQNYHYR